MHDENLYEYATLRYVPRIEREEFINVGLVMMCKRRRWMRLRVHIDAKRMEAFAGYLACDRIESQLDAFRAIAEGRRQAGPIAECPVEERFRWITAVKSACIQTSRPHPGLTDDLDATFDRLFAELVE